MTGGMNVLDRLVSSPRMVEIDHADLAAPPDVVWERIRHGDLARSPLARALFAIRMMPSGRDEAPAPPGLRLDDLVSTPERPGFQVLVDDPPRAFAVGAIGQVWQLDIPFVHVADADAFAAFAAPGWVKVAWAIRVSRRGDAGARIDFELRVDATDDDAWRKFRRYFHVIGPGSHFIRRSLFASLERELGTPEARENERPLAGDDLLPDAGAQLTDAVTIAAPPPSIWPWLLQMGCRRAGWYSIDALDNGRERSALEVHPELQDVCVGDVFAATPEGDPGFEVLRIDPPRALILGGLYDAATKDQLAFDAPRPARFWQVTWAFVLEPLDPTTTRLHVRARAAFPKSGRMHAAWIRPVHRLMQAAQLRNLAARIEGRMPRDGAREVADGIGGAARMVIAFVTPFLRGARSHWGLDADAASREMPGDALVPKPRWMWTHAVTIEAPRAKVWPFIAQIGADRGGFYSYQWLENIAGCGVRNAETVHPEWSYQVGDRLMLHPDVPPLRIADVVPGEYMVAYGAPDAAARAKGEPWAAASWLFHVESLGPDRCRFVSRFRSACSDDVASRLVNGPLVIEPVGFVMDRRMLLGVKERAERSLARERSG
jgi:hypothetical protein